MIKTNKSLAKTCPKKPSLEMNLGIIQFEIQNSNKFEI